MPKTQIILFTGKMQSGKDTAAAYVKGQLEQSVACEVDNYVKIYSFAHPLKNLVVDILNIPRHMVYGTDEEKNQLTHIRWVDLPLNTIERENLRKNARNSKFLSGRELLQILGTNIFRRMWYNCWVHSTLQQIVKDNPHFALIADCRFPNEINLLCSTQHDCLAEHPIVIRFGRNPMNKDHESETALDSYPFEKLQKFYYIDNTNMSIEDKNRETYEIIKGAL